MNQSAQSIIPEEYVASKIYFIRGQKVILDSDLADFYGIETGNLNKAVKRNIERFPEDFMFQLTKEELENWRSQIVTSNPEANLYDHLERILKLNTDKKNPMGYIWDVEEK